MLHITPSFIAVILVLDQHDNYMIFQRIKNPRETLLTGKVYIDENIRS